MIAALLTLGIVLAFCFGGGIIIVPIVLFICMIIGFCADPSADGFTGILILGGGAALIIYSIYHTPKYGNCGRYIDQKKQEFWRNRSYYILKNFYDITPNEKYHIQEYWGKSKTTKNYMNWEKKFHDILDGKMINEEQYVIYCCEQDGKLRTIETQLQEFSKFYIACDDAQKKVIDYIFANPYLDWRKVKDKYYYNYPL